MKMMKIKITLLAILAICLAFTSCGGPGGVLQSEWSRELHNNLNGMGISNKYTEVKHNYTSPAGQIFKSVVPIPRSIWYLRTRARSVRSIGSAKSFRTSRRPHQSQAGLSGRPS